MTELDPEFIEHTRLKAMHNWKWRNPYLVGFLTFLHPIGMLLSSVPAFFVYMLLWLVVWAYWPS